MTDLDETLRKLGAMPIPGGLETIDTAILVGLSHRQMEARSAPRMMALAAAFALVLGIGGGGLAGSEPAAAQILSPFSPDNPLAPSTLLDGQS